MKKSLTVLFFAAITLFSFGASYNGELIAKERKVTIDFRDMELLDVIRIIARNFDLNLIAGDNVKGKVTVSFSEVPVDEALETILKVNNYTYVKDGYIVRVMPVEDAKKEYGGKVVIPKDIPAAKIQKVYEVKNVEVLKIKDIVKSALKGNDQVIADENSNKLILYIDKEETEALEAILKEVDVGNNYKKKGAIDKNGRKISVIPVKYVNISNMAGIIKDVYPEFSGEIKANENAGGLIVNAKEDEIKNIEEIMKRYDISPQQVSIEAKIVEISGENSKTIGTEWSYYISPDDTNGNNSLEVSSKNPTVAGSLSDGGTLKFGMLNGPTFNTTLKALLTSTDSNLLSSPNITTLSGKAAVINVGDKIPYPVAASSGSAVTYAFEDVGIRLEVIPTVLENGVINMQVKSKVSNQNGKTPDNRPIVATRDADTNVMLKDGETLVIGGLMRQDEVNVENSIPFLGDIPIIGELFKSRSKNKKKTNLIFFITSNIIGSKEFKEKTEFNFSKKGEEKYEGEQLNLQNKKIIIKEYEENLAYQKAIDEIEKLKKAGMNDKEIDETYTRIKEKIKGGDMK